MSTLFDIFGFLSVVLRGLDLVAQSILLGSVSFALFIATPLARDAARELRTVTASVRLCIQWAALAAVIAATADTAVSAAVLTASLETSWREVARAGFVIAGAVKALAAAAIGVAVSLRPMAAASTRVTIGAAAALVLHQGLASSHATARLTDSALLMFATGAHELGAALWLGGLPCFWLALRRASTRETLNKIGRRFSALAIIGVATIVVGALVFVPMYIGSVDAVYGTAYGAMVVTKSVMFGMLAARCR